MKSKASKIIVPRLITIILAAVAAFGSISTAAAVVHPVPVDGQGIFHLNSGQGPYVGYAPDTYNPAVPISLFVWMHGCGGVAEGDMYAVAPYATRANQSYVAISIGGRDNACWDVNNDTPKVLAAIADVALYFNIDPRKIYLGGYSSGGDLTYRIGFQHTDMFAGLLVENSDPFRDTGASQASLLASASWKIHIAHLLHTEDDTYPAATVRASLATLTAHGFPVAKIEKPGHHYDNSDFPNHVGTDYDRVAYLLPYLKAGWVSPPQKKPTVSTKTKISTSRTRITLKGTAAHATSIEFKIGKGKYRTDKGDVAHWRIAINLKKGRNLVTVRSVGTGGKSTTRPIVIRRSS